MARKLKCPMAKTYAERVQRLLKPESVFDIADPEHRQLLIMQIERSNASLNGVTA